MQLPQSAATQDLYDFLMMYLMVISLDLDNFQGLRQICGPKVTGGLSEELLHYLRFL